MNKVIINSPAKINIGLNVLEKRDDGYHNIETIFYPTMLYDEITFEKSESFNFKCNSELLKNDINNIIIKAVKQLENYVDKKFNVNITLKKNIPLGSGMGGGSSNAASVLLSLNELYDLKLDKRQLKIISLQLGADVPFFLESKPKYAEGKGEILTDINLEINYPILLVNPGINISTKWAYEVVKPKKPDFGLKEILKDKIDNISSLKGLVTNDFEDPIIEKFAEIGKIKSDLYYSGASFALMTGSGSTLFAIYPSIEKAGEAEKFFSEKYFTFIHYEED